MSKRLSYDEQIAITLNFEAAAAYERLRWLIEESEAFQYIGEVRDGRRWVGFTYEKLRTSYLKAFKSDKVLRDTLNLLEKHGLIISRRNGHGKWFAVGDVTPDSLKDTVDSSETVTPSIPNGQTNTPNLSLPITQPVTPIDETGTSDVPEMSLSIYKDLDTVDSTKNSEDSTNYFSCEPPTATPPKKEKVESHFSLSIIDSPKVKIQNPQAESDNPFIKALADLCGINLNTKTSREIITELGEGVAAIQACDDNLRVIDFCYYKIYYDQLRNRKAEYPCPTIEFVVRKWPAYVVWLKAWLEVTERRLLLGTGQYLNLSRWDWEGIDMMVAGERCTYSDGQTYIKQPDGTFLAEAV